MSRFLISALCLLAFTLLPRAGGAAVEEISFAQVETRAKALAGAAFVTKADQLSPALQTLNYDTYREIAFNPARSLWHDEKGKFQAQFFHAGYLFHQPVVIHEIENGKVRKVPFSPDFFRYGSLPVKGFAGKNGGGFAGLRLTYPLNARKNRDEVISFLGASYFRALGAGQSYGLSARGIAIDTGEGMTEEFPAFTEFWLAKPKPGAREIEVCALLDGPSVAGAYRFRIAPGTETVLAVEAHLFFRQQVKTLGLAPLTSMFWRGEDEPLPPKDPRPEVHDSDGLLVQTSADTRIWHPLHATTRIAMNDFADTNPRGFGLLQRDRAFAHYRDREAKYDRRPSAWVDPVGDWGAGAVRLMQLPATNEYGDNVVAFWAPAHVPAAGEELTFRYRLHWTANESNKAGLARVVSTRTMQPKDNSNLRDFEVDFAEPAEAAALSANVRVSAPARLVSQSVSALPEARIFHLTFAIDTAGAQQPIDLDATLRDGDRPISETWHYTFRP